MIKVNNTIFKILKKKEIESILFASIDILENVGVKISDEEALKIFKTNDCIIKDDNIVHIPKNLVYSSLKSLPKSISIYNRLGKLFMSLGNEKSYFGTGSDCPNFIDPYTQKRRESNSNDVINSAIISDYLPEIDFHMSLSRASEKLVEHHMVHQYVLMLENTIKPLIVTAMDVDNLEKIYNIAVVVSQGEKIFKLKPNFILYIEPISPLFHPKQVLKKLIFAARNNIPCIYAPCPMSGATAPVTKAGTLVIALCDSLIGIVLSQILNPGTSIIMGGVVSNLDMSTLIMPGASPEFLTMSIALTEIARYLKIPMFSTAGCTDAKIFDEQAAIEVTDSILFASLSRAAIIHDLGFLQSSLTGCLEMVLMSNEIISKLKKVLQGIEVNEDSLMKDVIKKVGPCGNFLVEDSTIKLFKKEFYFPKLFDRNCYDKWVIKGKKKFGNILNEEVINILKNHRPLQMDSFVKEGIKEVLKEYN
ncbi:MAG: trimethylamine methyltransferase family protein [Candidatus Humimicrobiaceae bacterium]